MNDILNKAKEKLLEWSSNLCGFIHDKVLFFLNLLKFINIQKKLMFTLPSKFTILIIIG